MDYVQIPCYLIQKIQMSAVSVWVRVCVCRPKVDVGCLPSLPTLIFGTGSVTEPRTPLAAFAPHLSAMAADICQPGFYMGAKDCISGPHTHLAGI